MTIEELLAKYFFDFGDLPSNQQEYLSECFQIWYSCGLLKAVLNSQGGGDFTNLQDGFTVTCSVRTGNVQLDRASFEREVDSFEKWGPISTFMPPIDKKGDREFNLSALVGLGFQIEFCLSEEMRKAAEQNYEENWCELFSQQNPAGPVTSLSFNTASRSITSHHYWAEAVAAFSLEKTRLQLAKIDPKIHQLLHDLIRTSTYSLA